MGKESVADKILGILKTASMPMPGDEIYDLIGHEYKSQNSLANLKTRGLVDCRLCPDDIRHSEWWLIEREKEMEFWLSL